MYCCCAQVRFSCGPCFLVFRVLSCSLICIFIIIKVYLQLDPALPHSCYSNNVDNNTVDDFADQFKYKPCAQGHKIQDMILGGLNGTKNSTMLLLSLTKVFCSPRNFAFIRKSIKMHQLFIVSKVFKSE